MEAMRRQRVVLLGASNIAIGWKPLLQVLASGIDVPLDIYTAHGMGRSYISSSHFAWRRLPGIVESELWDALRTSPGQKPAIVLITDLGNDLVYGRSAQQVKDAAENCIERLRALDPECEIVVTRPPVDSVLDVTSWKYQTIRRLLFPACRLSLSQVKSLTLELDDLIKQLAEDIDVTLVRPAREWYGFDPIHVLRRLRTAAFTDFCKSWSCWDQRAATIDRLPVQKPVPAVRYLFGNQRLVKQPCIDSHDIRVFAW